METNDSWNTPFTLQPRPNNAKALTPKLKPAAFGGHAAVNHDTWAHFAAWMAFSVVCNEQTCVESTFPGVLPQNTGETRVYSILGEFRHLPCARCSCKTTSTQPKLGNASSNTCSCFWQQGADHLQHQCPLPAGQRAHRCKGSKLSAHWHKEMLNST